jgi:hypothetical protein
MKTNKIVELNHNEINQICGSSYMDDYYQEKGILEQVGDFLQTPAGIILGATIILTAGYAAGYYAGYNLAYQAYNAAYQTAHQAAYKAGFNAADAYTSRGLEYNFGITPNSHALYN